jgi:hypothetical protein
VKNDCRADVWAYFLGVYPFDLLTKDIQAKAEFDANLKKEYMELMARWQSPEHTLTGAIKDRRHRVEKDVVRTDSANPFYSVCNGSEETVRQIERLDHGSSVAIDKQLQIYPNWRTLRNLLMCYSAYRVDLGYVQGL